MNKRKYAPSTIIPVRFHLEEVAILDKKRKRATRSDFIRAKTLELDK